MAPPAPASTHAPDVPLAQVLTPAAFHHPRANREARLGHAVVGYEFRRARRKTIGFMVGADGLVVSAPRWVPLAEVDSALRGKAAWVVRKLEEARQRQQGLEAARVEWKDGLTLPFLGEPMSIMLDPHGTGPLAVLHTDAQALPGAPRQRLRVGLPRDAAPAQLRDAVQAWLMRQARQLFIERLEHFAPRLGVRWRKLTLSSANTRWGSASADGSVRLNWRLIHFRPAVIDYVAAHELSHLLVMNHSPRFWDTVTTVVPDHATLRKELRDETLPRW